MENFQKINEITPEEAKNLDSNRIEYIALSSGELYYIKKPNQQNNIQEENKKISAEYLDFIFKQKNEENNKIKEEGKESFIKNIKNDNSGKKIAISTTVIIPILYGISYLLYYYNNNCK